MNTEEIWKPIDNYEGKYEVSNFGRIKSFFKVNKQKVKYLKGSKLQGYLRAELIKDNVRKCVFIHVLVAKSFVNNPENKPQVNHKNCIKNCNFWWNLEWVTNAENQLHAYKNNLHISKKGEDHWNSKLNDRQVMEIFESNLPNKVLAGKYGVTYATITYIKKGSIWSHITNKKFIPSTRVSLNEDDVLKIFKMDGSSRMIANKYGVDKSTILNIKSGKFWSHITGMSYKKAS